MSETKQNRTLKGKELITIGIFSAIYFAINFVFMVSGGFHPIMWILMPAFIALFTGIPFMIMAAKVQKPFAVAIMGAITALIYFATGQFTMVILITFVISCMLAEVCRAATKYNSFWGNTLAFAFFSLGMTGSPLPVWLFRDDFFAQIREQGMPANYLASIESLASTEMLLVMLVAPFFLAIIGSFIAKTLTKKHFKKAGIV